MAELLGLLKITKQSLNRVLGELIGGGFVERKTGMQDRRTRRLRLTAQGKALADSAWSAQRPILAGAFKGAGSDAVNGYRRVLIGMVGDNWGKKP